MIYNAYLYSEECARYTCITRNSDTIRWIIDGLTNIDHYVTTIRRIQSRILLAQDGSFLSELLIPAISVNKHIAVIKCEAYNTTGGFQVAESNETAQYNIQGLLEMESNATYSRYNSTHNLVEWLEPPTLNITNVEPDIEGYTVCSCPKFNNSEPILECTNMSKPQILLPKYYADLYVVVTAWNIVGESNSSAQLMITHCSSTSAELPLNIFPVGERFVVLIEFDEDNSTVVYIYFTNNHKVCSSKISNAVHHVYNYYNYAGYACMYSQEKTMCHPLLNGACLSMKLPSVGKIQQSRPHIHNHMDLIIFVLEKKIYGETACSQSV